MKHIHIPTIEELMRPEPEFSIKATTNYYRITGIPYRGQNCNYFLGKRLLVRSSQDESAEDARTAKPNQYRAPPASLIYAICKTLFQNWKGKHGKRVEQVRSFLAGAFNSGFRYTLTRIIYTKTLSDEIIHDYKQEESYTIYALLKGPQGYITRPETKATECLQAILDTTDKPDTINEVFKWLTGLDTFLWRLEHIDKIEPNKITRAVEFGEGSNGAFVITALGSCSDYKAALAVHTAK